MKTEKDLKTFKDEYVNLVEGMVDANRRGLAIRATCAVGDIVRMRGSDTPVMIVDIPPDPTLNACKIVWIDRLGDPPASVSFNQLRHIDPAGEE